jgi:hypothetical protein
MGPGIGPVGRQAGQKIVAIAETAERDRGRDSPKNRIFINFAIPRDDVWPIGSFLMNVVRISAGTVDVNQLAMINVDVPRQAAVSPAPDVSGIASRRDVTASRWMSRPDFLPRR